MKFSDIKQDTPRLVVMFKRDGEPSGCSPPREMFQWGIVGQIPILYLVGEIIRVQEDVRHPRGTECPESAFVMVWDEATREFSWFIHPDIPILPLVGMLETIKLALTNSLPAQRMAAQQVPVSPILGPDGQAMRKGVIQ